MQNVKDVLTRVRQSWTEGGAGDDVRAALTEHRRRDFALLMIFASLTVVLLGVATALLVLKGLQTAKTFAGFAGLGGGGSLVLLFKVWRDWSRTDLLFILVEDASRAQIATLIDKLVRKI
jgi:hypothetical protein